MTSRELTDGLLSILNCLLPSVLSFRQLLPVALAAVLEFFILFLQKQKMEAEDELAVLVELDALGKIFTCGVSIVLHQVGVAATGVSE